MSDNSRCWINEVQINEGPLYFLELAQNEESNNMLTHKICLISRYHIMDRSTIDLIVHHFFGRYVMILHGTNLFHALSSA